MLPTSDLLSDRLFGIECLSCSDTSTWVFLTLALENYLWIYKCSDLSLQLFSTGMLKDLRCFTVATSSWRSKTKPCRMLSVSWRKGNCLHNRLSLLKELYALQRPETIFTVSRLRAGECDRCTILRENLKNNQDQNLCLIAKLSEFTHWCRYSTDRQSGVEK